MGKDKRGNGTPFSNNVKQRSNQLCWEPVKGDPECVLKNLFGRKPSDWDRKALVFFNCSSLINKMDNFFVFHEIKEN